MWECFLGTGLVESGCDEIVEGVLILESLGGGVEMEMKLYRVQTPQITSQLGIVRGIEKYRLLDVDKHLQ